MKIRGSGESVERNWLREKVKKKKRIYWTRRDKGKDMKKSERGGYVNNV